jgi:hypothetical protein
MPDRDHGGNLNGGTFGGIFGNGAATTDKHPDWDRAWPVAGECGAGRGPGRRPRQAKRLPERRHHPPRNRTREHDASGYLIRDNRVGTRGYGGGGGASRFFYVAKAPARERPKVDGIAHPTVKPLTLMRWLCRLVTPPGGTVLEPFAGSGTTIEAALMEGFRVVAIEREDDYLPLIAARLERVAQEPDDGQLTFDASA